MNKAESERLSAEVAAFIAREAPYIDDSPSQVASARRAYAEGDLALLADAGLYDGDFDKFYVINRFCEALGLWDRADSRWMQRLFRDARRLDPAQFLSNPYLKTVRVPDVRVGDFRLCTAEYARGELLQYDMPDLRADPVVPKLAFFTGPVRFPGIYEGDVPWMSVCPSEICSMAEPIRCARGRALVLGLGLGYYPFMISARPDVSSVVIVERRPEIIEIFRSHLLPQFPQREKIKIVQADAFAFLESVADGDFDFCFADIWENQFDGAAAYRRIRPHDDRLTATGFAYWIEDSIRWTLENEED